MVLELEPLLFLIYINDLPDGFQSICKIFAENTFFKINKCNRIIGSIKKVSLILPRTCLLTSYKAFVRPHLDYADIIYSKPDNESLKDWLEKIQCNAVLAITGAIRGTP